MNATTNRVLPVKAGDQIHFYESHTFGVSESWLTGDHTARRGETVTVTDAIISESFDRNGDSWLALADDTDAQLSRWGRVVFAIGPWPADAPLFIPGSLEWAEARETARKAAHATVDRQQKAEDFQRLHEDFGSMPTTSKTLHSIDAG